MSSIHYRQRLERVKDYLESKDYQVVVKECGTLLECALRDSYERLLALTPPEKIEQVREAEYRICRPGQTYDKLGLGTMIRLIQDGQVFHRLSQKDRERDYRPALHFNFNQIVDVDARNRATHHGGIPKESTATLAYASLMAFLEAIHLLELPPEIQQQREEQYRAHLIRLWAKGYLSAHEEQQLTELAAELELTASLATRIHDEVRHDLRAAIESYQASRVPDFEAPPPRAYLSERHNLPSVLASQLQTGLTAYLKSTFPINSRYFEGIIDRFLAGQEVLRGPYLSLKLPFESGDQRLSAFFPELSSRFMPYKHQAQAFSRLSGPRPQPTLVATGTGSGKTECFLYPVLHHCYQERGKPGIKAILIYPMNALATDQARRLADLIWNNPQLKGQVNAGLYVGDRSGEPAAALRADSLITDREVLRDAPPDILLTNYKMLDLLLTRPEDHRLWRDNRPETLQFVIVDEIHTFDGAQGTDLACLLRRLKSRLKTPAGHLCPVGTSATLGAESADQIRAYASQIFGETFDAGALIQEQRKSFAEFVFDSQLLPDPKLHAEWQQVLEPEHYPDYASYIQAQIKFWFGDALPPEQAEGNAHNWRVRLGKRLKQLRLFYNFVSVLHKQTLTRDQLIARLSESISELRALPASYNQALLDSLLALISSARSIPDGFEHEADPPLMPFMHVRAQVWLRELRRLVASLDPEAPNLHFADDQSQSLYARLPLIHCRDCHSVAWSARKHPHRSQYIQGLPDFYSRYRKGKNDLWLLYPDTGLNKEHGHLGAASQVICPGCLEYAGQPEDLQHTVSCPLSKPKLLRVTALPLFSEHTRGEAADCQFCSGEGSLSIVGHRASSLSSVMIAQLFGSHYSDDKKLIAFSDSVQDASYRAGFFTARTYAFTLRTALQQSLPALPSRDQAPSLTELAGHFSDHWLRTVGPARYISQFLPADMGWMQEVESFHESGDVNSEAGQSLLQQVSERLEWEIYRELTFRSRIGRTLEKSGLAMVSIPLADLDAVVRDVALLLPNEFPQLAGLISADTLADRLRHFLALLLRQLKQVGAVYFEPVAMVFKGHMPYAVYANARGMKRPPWLPRRQGYSGPRPLTLNQSKLEALILQNRSSWYQWLADKLLFDEEAVFARGDRDRLLRCILEQLTRHNLLIDCRKDPQPGWAIAPERLRLSTAIGHLACSDCHHTISVPAAEVADWENQPCGSRPCESGLYRRQADGGDYYRDYYAHAVPERVFAAEHTGLLKRAAREAVEKQFMAPKSERTQRPWYTNLLSSTPTLEMGIDIGDLSTVLLCSVPPNASNYIQRIGRSGRSDGNSLNLTVATGRPHDLYFFREPLEMIEGQVQTPGVFLGAAAVLERQLTAYCFDRWVESGIGPDAIDRQFKTVMSTLTHPDPNPQRFPFNLLGFISAHQTLIFEGFMGLFGAELPTELRAELREHLWQFLEADQSEGSLAYKILQRLTHLAQECANYERDIKLLRQRIKRAEEHPALDAARQQELDQLRQEAEGLRGIVKLIKDKRLFNLLTDEGLLPNYAFPEEGITLRSVVYRKLKTPKDASKHYESMEYEYVRPAASALVELAPNNHFYAGGRRVRINQVELRFSESTRESQVRQPVFERWRFCDACSHMALEGTAPESRRCPVCGSEGWADLGRIKHLVRMRQVFANTNIQDSLHLDSSEERSSTFFSKAMHVQHQPEDILQAYRLQDQTLAFGFEYLRRVKLRDVNFGESEGEGFGQTASEGEGFLLCVHCGMVQEQRVLQQPDKAQHAITCRRPKEQTRPQDLFSAAYLYREFQSEALRVFLPDDARFSGESCRLSFVAALQLGLRKHFAGNIDHLATTGQTEPDHKDSARHFLVIYDQVPGGTGYLKELSKADENGQPILRQVLIKARDALRSCECQQSPDLDGCYRCVLSYRQNHRADVLKRSTALELLNGILNTPEGFVTADNLTGLRPHGLQESELERRFLEALRREGNAGKQLHQLRLIPEVVNGKLGYVLHVNAQRYSIEPQVKLGPEQGVAVPSRADFVIRSLLDESSRPIAIYTDGFAHHHQRLGLDSAQRMALIHSGKYWVWSLSWHDVDGHISAHTPPNYSWDPLPESLAQQPAFKMLGAALPQPFKSWLDRLHSQSPLQHLLHFLAHPVVADWSRLGDILLMTGVSQIQPDPAQQPALNRGFKEQWMNVAPSDLYDQTSRTPEGLMYYPDLLRPDAALPDPKACLQWLARFPQMKLTRPGSEGQIQWLQLDDGDPEATGFQNAWNGWLRLLNLLQFAPGSWFVCHSGLQSGAYQPILQQQQQLAQTPPSTDSNWQALEALLAEEAHVPLLRAMAAHGCRLPVLGYEPTSTQGEVLGQIEIAFIDTSFGLIRPEDWEEWQQSARMQQIKAQGWILQVLDDEVLNDPTAWVEQHANQMGATV